MQEQMTEREMYVALRREFLTLQREKAEVEVAYGRLRAEYLAAAGSCSCGAYGTEGHDDGMV